MSSIELTYAEWKKKPTQVHARDLFLNMPLEVFIEDWMTIEDPTTGLQVPFRLWPKQRDLCNWIESNKLGFTAKARQRGGSEIFACLAIKIFLSELSAEVLAFSRGEDDAKYFLEKRIAKKLKALPPLVDDKGQPLIIWPKFNIETYKITSSYGTSISALSSHPDAGSGRTVRLVILDEAEKIEDAAAIWLSVKPTVDQNPKGQLFALSTGQKHGTWFKSYIKKLYDKEVSGVGLFFLPWNTDPSKDEAWYQNELSQFDSEVDMRCTYPSLIEDIFLSKEGKVFPQFDDQNGGRHVQDYEKFLSKEKLYGMDMYLAYDPGFNPHPAAFLVCLYNRYSDMLFVHDEIVLCNEEIVPMGKKIRNMVDGYPARPKKCLVDTYANRKSSLSGLITETTVLNQVTGLRFTGANKANADGSREMVSRRLSEDKIMFHPRCIQTIKQMAAWVWGPNGKPVDEGDDTIDDLRYICAELRPGKVATAAPKIEAYSQQAAQAKYKAGRLLKSMLGSPEGGANSNYSWLAG